MQDHRSVPLEVLRDFVRSQAELTSLRAFASQVGIGRTTLHGFANGETITPHPRVRRILGLCYLESLTAARDIGAAHPHADALRLLLTGLPEAQRQPTAQSIRLDLQAGYEAAGQPLPKWLELLLEAAVSDRLIGHPLRQS